MKMYSIEIDENIWHLLQQNAEPFVDTPNSVLNRLLTDDEAKKIFPKGWKTVKPYLRLVKQPRN